MIKRNTRNKYWFGIVFISAGLGLGTKSLPLVLIFFGIAMLFASLMHYFEGK